MGLDILILTDNFEELFPSDYFDEERGLYGRHKLSRSFCNMMLRRDSYGEPELDQIGRIAGVDITPLYDMENALDRNEIDHRLSYADNETERQLILNEIQNAMDKLENNIEKVLKTVNALIDSLSYMKDISNRLDPGLKDTIGYEYYFTDFGIDKGRIDSENNFGQDIRNMKRFLEFARINGRTKVWFQYG